MGTWWRALTLLLALALAVLGGAGCGEQAASRREFRIGLIAPLSGQIPEVGQASLEAARLAVQEVNEDGGLLIGGARYRLVLLVEDDADKAEQAVGAALKLINQRNVSAIVGPQASRNAIPAARVAEQARIPLISPWSTNPETTRNKQWVFRVAFIDTFQGPLMARFAYHQLGLRRAALLFDVSSEYNRSMAEVFSTAFERLGGEVVAYEPYTRDVPELSRQWSRIRAARPDLLFLPNYYNEVPQQARQARAQGISARLLGGDSWGQIPAAERAVLEGGFFSTHYAIDDAGEQAREFVTRYREAYNRDPDDVAALTFDAFGMLFQAAQRQGGVEPQQIRDGLGGLELYQGITGRIAFSASGDPIKSAVVLEVKEGTFRFHSRVAP